MNLDFVESIHLSQQLAVMLKNKPVDHVDVVVAPPFVDLRSVTSVVESERMSVTVAAQHVNPNENGAHTGEVSVSMLKRLQVEWVLIGHSERRGNYGQTDEIVNETIRSTARGGLNAVVCCGESKEVREAGDQNEFVEAQLRSAFEGLDKKYNEAITVAYEPIWAIGTGLVATVEQVKDMMAFVRSVLADLGLENARVLYGGSVNAENAQSLMEEGDVGGFLVGGASLKAESFMTIVQAANDCYAEKR
jgi:triosephosphate isomerase